MRNFWNDRAGLTLVEMMVAMVVLSFVVLGTIGSFGGIQTSLHRSKLRAVGTSQAQEKIQTLKQTSYHHLSVTEAPAVHPLAGPYDTDFYPPETVQEAGLLFQRYTLVEKAKEQSGVVKTLPATDPETGLKQITVTIIWKQGDEPKTLRLVSLYANPALHLENGSLAGDVRDGATGAPIQGAAVTLAENNTLSATTDANGRYAITAPPGNYTARVAAQGFGTRVEQVSVSGAMTRTSHFALDALKKGTVSGEAYVTDHLLLSEICASFDGDEDNEYVEIYNPTPEPLSLNGMRLSRVKQNNHEDTLAVLPNTVLRPSQYYLVASDRAGFPVNATWTGEEIPTGRRGGIVLRSAAGEIIDRVAWTRRAAIGNVTPGPDDAREGATGVVLPYDLTYLGSDGLEDNEVIERKARRSSESPHMRPGGADIHAGNAWDSDRNDADWVHHIGRIEPQNTNSALEARQSGTPAAGGFVSVNDGLSTAAAINFDGTFQVSNVAVNALDAANKPQPWKIVAFSPAHGRSSQPLDFDKGDAPNFSRALTQNIYIDQPTDKSYVIGRVTDVLGNPIASPGVRVRANGNEYATDENGRFYLTLPAGDCTLEANPAGSGFYNPRYVSESKTFPLAAGALAQNIDFALSMGFRLTGQALKGTTGDPLPFVHVEARRDNANGALAGQAITDAQGNFAISNLRVGFAYDVRPIVGHAGERADPGNQTVTSHQATQPHVALNAPFRVSTAMGRVMGRVTKGGHPVQAGVVILATREDLAGSPILFPGLKATEPNANYYFTTVREDGTYDIPVLGGDAAAPLPYRVYAFVPGANGLTAAAQSGLIDVVAGKTNPRVANLPLP